MWSKLCKRAIKCSIGSLAVQAKVSEQSASTDAKKTTGPLVLFGSVDFERFLVTLRSHLIDRLGLVQRAADQVGHSTEDAVQK